MKSRLISLYRPLPVLLVGITGLLVRLALSWFSQEVQDVARYREVASTILSGGHLYTDTASIYPYPPLWSWVETTSELLSGQMGLSFAFTVELLPIMGDMGISLIIYKMALKCCPSKALLAFSFYALNPLPIINCSVVGQFDSLMIFFGLLAIFLFESKRYKEAALALMVAISFKAFICLLLPFFFYRLGNWRDRLIFLAITCLPIGLMLSPYFFYDFNGVLRELFGYSGVTNQGIFVLVHYLMPFTVVTGYTFTFSAWNKLLFLGIFFAIIYRSYLLTIRDNNEPDKELESWTIRHEATLAFLSFYVIYSNIGSQYLLWILPFLILLDLKAAVSYSFLSILSCLAFYYALTPEILYGFSTSQFTHETGFIAWLFFTSIWWGWCLIKLVNLFKKLFGKSDLSQSDSLSNNKMKYG